MSSPLFVSHGSPMIALEKDGDYARALGAFGAKNRPRAVAVVSAHWQTRDPRVTATPRLIYDFGGFPDELRAVQYPFQGDPKLAAEIAGAIGGRVEERGIDHGAWVPLRFLYPRADVPVVQVSLPFGTPDELRRYGEKLARFEDVLLVGSGGTVHNLRLLHWEDDRAPEDAWAREFDDWLFANLGPGLDHARHPSGARAAPTSEHMDPLYVALGAGPGGVDELVYDGFRHGNLSMRTFSLKPATRPAAGR